jgi:DNA adenine methylase
VTRDTPRPFLKWVGGKGQLLPQLRARYEAAAPTGRYHEPFVGGGALFFDLYRNGLLGRKRASLSDNNPLLVDAYTAVRDETDALIDLLREHKARHGHDHYYATRAARPDTAVERAARLIYLNKTCFNGLYRENSRGEFNVPIGKYKNPAICDEENLRACAGALARADLHHRPFDAVRKHAKPGDFVYFDPPYDPVSKTASFTAYARDGFGEADQRRLADLFRALRASGVHVLLSNAHTPLIRALYAGLNLMTVDAIRSVNSRADRRGAVEEVLVWG